MTDNSPVSKITLTGVIQPVRIGFVPLADCAPLLMAEARGMFQRHGVMVRLSCEMGWATVREKLLYRQLDASHAIAGLALAMQLGISAPPMRMIAPLVLNLHGNAITLSRDLWHRGVRDAKGFRKLVRSEPDRRFAFGVTSRFSSHAFLLRQWLASAGMENPDLVQIFVLPPTQMAANLAAGLIDGFCVGEPWNSVAVADGSGWIAATSEQLSPGHPEKVLLMPEQFALEHCDQALAVVAALREACAFCDAPENRAEVVRMLAASGYFPHCHEALKHSLIGPFPLGTSAAMKADHFHLFHRQNANEPLPERGRWLVQEFLQQGLIRPEQLPAAEEALRACWRTLPAGKPAAKAARTKQVSPHRHSKLINP